MMTLYHGTDSLFDEIDLSKCENNRDFGIGFSTTTISAQAASPVYDAMQNTESLYWYESPEYLIEEYYRKR